nr:mechanosensitive ion channel family protein [Leptolyngbya sp. FACHB-36]
MPIYQAILKLWTSIAHQAAPLPFPGYKQKSTRLQRISRRRNSTIGNSTIAAVIAIVLITSGAAAQTPTPKLSLPNSIVPTVSPSSDVSNANTADVHLDGRRLFVIAVPAVRPQPNQSSGTVPIRERVSTVETTLNRVANSAVNPNDLQVTVAVDSQSNQPVISIGDRYLMTVTALDAQLQGQDPERRANELVPIIRDALITARKERQPEYLTRQAILAGQILLAMIVASWTVSRVQQHLKLRKEQIQQQLTPTVSPNTLNASDAMVMTAVQQQMSQRQQRNVNDVQRRLSQLLQVGIWSGGSFVILELFPYTRSLQPFLFSGPLKLLGIVLVTYLAIRISDVLIDRFFSALTPQELLGSDTSQRLALRVSTFSRVLRSVVGVLCVGTAVLTALSLLGVELGPVLAGAGILGLAVSFASQNLIKDVINGMLILYEDQFAVGDVIQVGKVSGFVESLNLRITQLRNAEGRLITIPNSAITIVENLSKDWSRVDLAITIAYDADVDKAIEVIRRVGDAMCQDSGWQPSIPEPPEVLGIDEINNAGITIRVWIKTLPLKQWLVAREFRRRLKQALDAEGIAIGVPQQPLWFRSSVELAKPDDDKDDKH